VIVAIYRNPNACLITIACANPLVTPLHFRRFRLIHDNESPGMKSSTLTDSAFIPWVAATIALTADTVDAIDAACSQCLPNGSHW
jgi:hypothetical protein